MAKKTSAWVKHVTSTYKEMKKRNRDAKLGDAMKEAKKTYKKNSGGGSPPKVMGGGSPPKVMGGGSPPKVMGGGSPPEIMGGKKRSNKSKRRRTNKRKSRKNRTRKSRR